MTTKTVYLGSDDQVSIMVTQKIWDETEQDFVESPIDFVSNNTTEMILLVAGREIKHSENPEQISFKDGGVINISLGAIDSAGILRSRPYEAIIKVIDSLHQLGQDIVRPSRPDCNLSLIFK